MLRQKKKKNENDKKTNFMMKSNKKMPKNVYKALLLWNRPTESWCNMLQTLERHRNTEVVSFGQTNTLLTSKLKMTVII